MKKTLFPIRTKSYMSKDNDFNYVYAVGYLYQFGNNIYGVARYNSMWQVFCLHTGLNITGKKFKSRKDALASITAAVDKRYSDIFYKPSKKLQNAMKLYQDAISNYKKSIEDDHQGLAMGMHPYNYNADVKKGM